jgi:peptidoglycan/LPS O-acetylase OafA/YrhL
MYHSNYKISFLPKFLLKRLLRLEPPYIFSIVIAIIIISLRKIILKNNDLDFNLQQIGLHLGYLIPFFEDFKWINQVYWTLAIEFQYYLLIAILFIPITSENKYIRFSTFIILLLSGLITKSEFLPYWLPIFLLGILIFLYKINKIKTNEFLLTSVITITFLYFNHSVGEIFYSLIGVITIVFFHNKSFKIGDLFGEISYSIYLTHTIIGASVINILSHNVTSVFQKTLVILFGLLITFFVSKLMYRFIEKPSKLLSSKIKYLK